jgi:Zeta toxin
MSSADETDQSSGQWVTARAPLHDRIVAAHFAGKKPSREGRHAVYFTAGGGASGRTGAVFDVRGKEMTAAQLADPLTGVPDVVVVDPDRIKKLIPEFQLLREAGDQIAALFVRAEAASITRRIVAEAQRRRFSYLCYTTGSSPSFLEHIAAAKAGGYETQVTMTSRPTNEAIVRSMQRGDRSQPTGAATRTSGSSGTLTPARLGT